MAKAPHEREEEAERAKRDLARMHEQSEKLLGPDQHDGFGGEDLPNRALVEPLDSLLKTRTRAALHPDLHHFLVASSGFEHPSAFSNVV